MINELPQTVDKILGEDNIIFGWLRMKLFNGIFNASLTDFNLIIIYQLVVICIDYNIFLECLIHLNLLTCSTLLPIRRKSTGGAREAVAEQSAGHIQRTGAARGQRVGSTCCQVRTDTPANHRCGKCASFGVLRSCQYT